MATESYFDKSLQFKVQKVLRYLRIYGLRRTWFKVMGRSRPATRVFRPRRYRGARDIGMIGCGQFAFSSIGYVLSGAFGNRFVDCYDTAPNAHASFARFYRIKTPSGTAADLIANPAVKIVFIASNHASHTDYAIAALKAGKQTYVEKPVSVTWPQLAALTDAVRTTGTTIFAGYNRPFSPAIRALHKQLGDASGPVTLNCFISGHMIADDHWYRDPLEGTRICGNVGHWLDIAVHVISWRNLPDRWQIQLLWSDPEARDDNMTISMASEEGDLVTITLSARNEPFEGINETINFQQNEVTAKIDDFRWMTIWKGPTLKKVRFWPKNVGHSNAILQPFNKNLRRNWEEIICSAMLVLHITDMVRNGVEKTEFSFSAANRRLEAELSKKSNTAESIR